MPTPSRSFQQVRSLLGQLDRSIDEARHRRLGVSPAPLAQTDSDDTGPLDQVIGRAG